MFDTETEVEWTAEREISGFGGDYEDECRSMVKRGFRWLNGHTDADPQFSGYKGIYGIINEDNDDAEALVKAMLGDATGHTGAMVQATTGHVMAIKRHGWSWEEYQEYLDKETPKDDSE